MVALDHPPVGTAARRWTGIAAVLAAVLSLALLGVRSWRIDYPYSIDFQVYWLAGSRVAAGNATSLYEPGGGPDEGVPLEMPRFEFKNLPIVSVAFVPFAGLEYFSAKRVFWWISFGALLGSAVLLGRFVLPGSLGGTGARIAWSVAMICIMAPAHTSLRHGQTTPLVLLLLTAYVVFGLRERRRLSGACLALAGTVKLPVLFLAGLEAVRRRWSTVAAWGVVLAAIVALSLVGFGRELHRQYVAGLEQHAGTVMTGHNNQSIPAVVTRITGQAGIYDWEPRPIPAAAMAASVVVTLLLGGILAWGLARRPARAGPGRLLLDFSAVLAFGLVVMPVAWDHYFLLLVPAVAALATGLDALGPPVRRAVLGALAVAFAAIAIPTPQRLLDGGVDGGLPGSLLLSHYFAGAVLILVLAVAGPRRKEAKLHE
jgi:hypothetical protein